MTVVFSVALAASFIFSLILTFYVVRIASRLSALEADAQRWTESPTGSLSERLNDLAETVSLLANRVKMMKVRAATTHTDRANGHPDPYKDPAAWRAEINRKLAFGKTPGGI